MNSEMTEKIALMLNGMWSVWNIHSKEIIAENYVVVKIKVKFTLEQAVKDQRGCRSMVLFFL